MFYHEPKFVLMDESTSALDLELESRCMELCTTLKITLISVGHRPSLKQFHKQVLTLTGDDGRFELAPSVWTFSFWVVNYHCSVCYYLHWFSFLCPFFLVAHTRSIRANAVILISLLFTYCTGIYCNDRNSFASSEQLIIMFAKTTIGWIGCGLWEMKHDVVVDCGQLNHWCCDGERQQNNKKSSSQA